MRDASDGRSVRIWIALVVFSGLAAAGCGSGSSGTEPEFQAVSVLSELAADFARQILAAFLL